MVTNKNGIQTCSKVKIFMTTFLYVCTHHHASFTAHTIRTILLLHLSFVVIILLEALQEVFSCDPGSHPLSPLLQTNVCPFKGSFILGNRQEVAMRHLNNTEVMDAVIMYSTSRCFMHATCRKTRYCRHSVIATCSFWRNMTGFAIC
jgi:hypothetical protein